MIPTLIRRVRNDPAIKEVISRSAGLYAAGGVSVVLLITQQLVTARSLGARDFGALAAAVGVVVLIGLLSDIRSWELATRLLAQPIATGEVAKVRSTFVFVLRLELATGVLGASAVLLTAPIVAGRLIEDLDVVVLMTLAPTIILRQISAGASAAVLRMLDKYGWIATRSIVNGLLRFALIAGPAIAGGGPRAVAAGLLAAEAAGAASMLALSLVAYRREHDALLLRGADPLTATERGTVRSLAWSLWLSATIKSLHVESFVPVAAGFTSAAQIGVLRNGLDVGGVSTQATTPIVMVISPRLVLMARGDRQSLLAYVRTVQRVLVAVVLPVMTIALVGAYALLPSILGEDFRSVRPVAALLIIALGISAATQWVRPVLVGLDRVSEQNRLGVLTGLVSLGALPLLTSSHGAVGAAADMLGFVIAYSTLSVSIARKAMNRNDI